MKSERLGQAKSKQDQLTQCKRHRDRGEGALELRGKHARARFTDGTTSSAIQDSNTALPKGMGALIECLHRYVEANPHRFRVREVRRGSRGIVIYFRGDRRGPMGRRRHGDRALAAAAHLMKKPSFADILETVQRDVTRVVSHYPLITGLFFKIMNQRELPALVRNRPRFVG